MMILLFLLNFVTGVKKVAEKEAVPVYTIFTNEQLAQIAQNRVISKTGLQEISRVGDARVKKYGDDVVSIVSESMLKKSDEIGK